MLRAGLANWRHGSHGRCRATGRPGEDAGRAEARRKSTGSCRIPAAAGSATGVTRPGWRAGHPASGKDDCLPIGNSWSFYRTKKEHKQYRRVCCLYLFGIQLDSRSIGPKSVKRFSDNPMRKKEWNGDQRSWIRNPVTLASRDPSSAA